jgi:hypothetical protein
VIYLYWYLGIGVAVLAVVFSAHRLTKKDEPESLRDLLDAVNPDRKRLSYRILNDVVAPVLAAVAVVVVWPGCRLHERQGDLREEERVVAGRRA